MSAKVEFDSTLLRQLDAQTQELEMCDANGRTVGYFLPPPLRDRLLYAWAKAQFTDEELEIARNQTGALTTEELLERLGPA